MRKNYTVQYRRKRKGITDYNLRMKLLGANLPRLVIRRSSNNFVIQVIEFREKGDRVLASASVKDLQKFKWKGHTGNRSAAYMIGFICGKKTKEKGISKCILDIGRHRSVKANSLYAALKGFLESDINVPHNENMLPSEDYMLGKASEEYFKKIGKDFKNYAQEIKEIKGKLK